MWKIAGTFSVAAVTVAQETPEVNSDWQVKTGKDYNPNPGGCPYELRGARLSECETHAETSGWAAFSVDSDGNCCFKDGEVHDMLNSLVTSHDHDFHYTLSVAVTEEKPQVNSDWQVKTGKDYNPNPGGCPYELRGARLSECETHAETGGWGAFSVDSNGNCCFKDGEVHDMLGSLVTSHDHDFYYTLSVVAVESDWQVKNAKDYNPGGCPYELRGARLSECEAHAETGGWSAFTVDTNGNCCFKDGEVQEMLESLVTSHDHDFHYTLTVVAVADSDGWQRESKKGLDKHYDPYHNCTYALRGARLSECEVHAEAASFAAFTRDINGTCCFKDGEVQDLLNSLVTNNDTDFYYQHPESMLNTVEVV